MRKTLSAIALLLLLAMGVMVNNLRLGNSVSPQPLPSATPPDADL